MNFTPNLPTLLSGRAQQQQVPVTTTSGSPQNANMQKTNNSINIQQVSSMAKIGDEKSQVPPPSVHQQIQSAQIINNNMGGASQQLTNVQHQVNVSRNLNLPQQPAFSVAQQHVMNVSQQGNQKVGSIYQQMQQMAFQSQYQQSAPISQAQQLPVHSTAMAGPQNIFQKLQATIPQALPQLKQVAVQQSSSQQHVKQANQLSPSAPQQNMQYSPSKTPQQHPQMKTTAKLASPGSQLQNIQRSPSAAVPHHLIVQPVPPTLALNKNVPSTTASMTSASAPQQPNEPLKNQASIIPIKQPVIAATTTLLQVTTLSNAPASPQPIGSPTTPKIVATEAKPVSIKPVDQPKESIASVPPQAKPVPKLSVEEKVATSAPKTMPLLVEAYKKVEKSPAAQEAPVASASIVTGTPAAKNATPLASKSTMRLATVTPNRQKKPPATAPNNKKVAGAQAGTSAKTPAKVAVVSKPAEPAKASASSPKKATAPPATALTILAPSSSVAQSPSAVSLKTKRSRVKVQHFQSPTPEIALVTKLSTQTANPNKNGNNDDKLTIFYKNEFLALRNGEEGFFLCQTMHNVYKSSSKIKIRWLDEQKKPASSEVDGRTYSLSYFDTTDFECVLTTVDLNKVEGKIYELEEAEQTRIESILKKAIDVEKGVAPRPTVTEENPDGLDLSLYKDEAQLEKISPTKRKRSAKEKNEDDDDEDYEEVPSKKRNKSTPVAKSLRAAAIKPVVNEDSTESDEENLMEIKNKAKKQAPETPAAKSKASPKAMQLPKVTPPPKPSTSTAGRGAKRGSKAAEESPAKVAKTVQKVEAVKQSPVKASTSKLQTAVRKEPAKSLLKNEPVEEARPAVKKSDEKTNGSKIQQSPAGNSKKSPAKSKSSPVDQQARSTRSRK